ncbi:MAG: uridine kinase [Bacteroidales bacterium]|nr:uridine kinase [Bacteroidales bacterium]
MLVIGIAGGSGSGKTTLVKKIIESLPAHTVGVMSQDAYYYDMGELTQEEKESINFDHPSSIEFSLMLQHIKNLRAGKKVEMPTYSYVTCRRGAETVTIDPTEVLIVEGILIFTDADLRAAMDLKVFVDTDSDERIIRIIQRDVKERGRDLGQSIVHYQKYVKPMHETFIEPTKKYANVIIPLGGFNVQGIDILTSKIRETIALAK